MVQQTIKVEKQCTKALTSIVAGLVREGIVFTCELSGDYWVITMTGF